MHEDGWRHISTRKQPVLRKLTKKVSWFMSYSTSIFLEVVWQTVLCFVVSAAVWKVSNGQDLWFLFWISPSCADVGSLHVQSFRIFLILWTNIMQIKKIAPFKNKEMFQNLIIAYMIIIEPVVYCFVLFVGDLLLKVDRTNEVFQIIRW